jgi:hypothetical protein
MGDVSNKKKFQITRRGDISIARMGDVSNKKKFQITPEG